jgi:osmotically-inducible protein OsmY
MFAMHKPNMLLESDINEELSWDSQLDCTRIVVSADSGNVTLTGSVPSFDEVMLAEEDVRRVGGVKSLDNQLLVGLIGDAITDGEITVAAMDALDADHIVPSGSVNADVLEGYLTLTGQVRNGFQRKAAEHAVRKVDGLVGVDDKITISSDPIPSDIADRIQKALERNAIINDSLIAVTNEGPTIFLDGTTDSWAARQEAEDTAWAAPGVTDVVDRLVVA